MDWIYLIIAGLLEIGWALGMKATVQSPRPWLVIATLSGMILSFGLLSLALRTLPVGTAYAIWTGIGAVGTALLGILFFGESKDISRLLSILLIIIGIVGLKFFSPKN